MPPHDAASSAAAKVPPGLALARLAGAGEFEALFKRGRRIDGRYMQLIVAPTTAPQGRVGFVISRKALSRAVERNRLRRQIRAMLAARVNTLRAFDLIVRVRAPLARSDLAAAAQEARALIARVG
ncbi:MAG: ribonuclease P protein component [Casimicrobiaceae bacterium]